MKTYGFGIVGCGMISRFHADGLSEVPNAKLVAVSSRADANRQKMAAKYGCDTHADYRELVARKDIDIITIATPSGAHLEPVLAAARAGKHVIVEKPIEITLARCDAMIKACKENHVMLCGIFPYRFTPGARALKRAVDQGRFGRLTVGDAYNKWYRTQDYYDSGAWRGTWKLDGGGATMNQGIHAVDLIQWYLGPVAAVTAFTDCLTHERIEIEDTAVAALRYRNGALGVIECATSVYPGFPRKSNSTATKAPSSWNRNSSPAGNSRPSSPKTPKSAKPSASPPSPKAAPPTPATSPTSTSAKNSETSSPPLKATPSPPLTASKPAKRSKSSWPSTSPAAPAKPSTSPSERNLHEPHRS